MDLWDVHDYDWSVTWLPGALFLTLLFTGHLDTQPEKDGAGDGWKTTGKDLRMSLLTNNTRASITLWISNMQKLGMEFISFQHSIFKVLIHWPVFTLGDLKALTQIEHEGFHTAWHFQCTCMMTWVWVYHHLVKCWGCLLPLLAKWPSLPSWLVMTTWKSTDILLASLRQEKMIPLLKETSAPSLDSDRLAESQLLSDSLFWGTQICQLPLLWVTGIHFADMMATNIWPGMALFLPIVTHLSRVNLVYPLLHEVAAERSVARLVSPEYSW